MKRRILAVASAMAVLTSNFTGVLADSELTGKTISIKIDLSDPKYLQKVSKAFENPNVSTVNVIDTSLKFDNLDNNYDIITYISTRYEATGKKKAAGNYTGSRVLAQAKGGPGVTLQISRTCNVSNNYSCSVPVVISTINSVVGFSVTSSKSITVSGSAAVPSVHNNKKVKSMTLTAYPYYLKYTYSVMKIINSSGLVLRQNAGSGSASRFTGCSFKRTYTYK